MSETEFVTIVGVTVILSCVTTAYYHFIKKGYRMKEPMFLDIEIYPNYSLFSFRKKGKLQVFDVFGADKSFSKKDISKITKLLKKNLIVTFNGIKYDLPLVQYELIKSPTTYQLHLASKAMIEQKLHVYLMYKKAGVKRDDLIDVDHIDLIDVAKGSASLKLYGTRMHSKKLWELPYDPMVELTKKEAKNLRDYCENDLIVTEDLWNILQPDIQLRVDMSKKYGIDLRSLKGANIAQQVILKEVGYTGDRMSPPDFIKVKPPKFIEFKTKEYQKVHKFIKKHKFLVSDSGKVELPAKLKNWEFSHRYHIQLGIGGLHLSPKSESFYADKKYTLLDIDVTSFYPTMIIKNKFLIKHLGDSFLKTLEEFYNTRIYELKPKLATLKKGTKEYNDALALSNGYKLILNSFFGKTGEKWSKLYDPSVMLHTTLTGQLILLMYIETLELAGYEVLYGNTDGITIRVKRKDVDKVKKIIAKLDKKCKVNMEFETFKAMHLRDVNNFVNITESGYVKAKGAYAPPLIDENNNVNSNALDKNIDAPVVYKAVREYLHNGTPVEITIKEMRDVRQFLVGRQVRGGALWSGDIPELYPEDWEEKLNSKRGLTKKIIKEREKMEAMWVRDNGTYLGKVVRFYYSTNGHSIHYKSNGNKVPKSDDAKPMMDLVEKIPKDLNYDKYIDYAIQALEDLGVSYE